MTSAVFKIAGEAVQMRPGEVHAWSLTPGVAPYSRVFQLGRESAKKIFKRAKGQFSAAGKRKDPQGPVEIEIKHGGKSKKFKKLYVIEPKPGDNPNTMGLEVVDKRWLWRYRFISKDYNIPIKTGERVLKGGSLVPVQIKDAVGRFVYRPETLYGGLGPDRPWTAKEVLRDILVMLLGEVGTFQIDDDLSLEDTVEGLSINDSGTAAVARVLSLIPGADICLTPAGVVRVFNTLNGKEIGVARGLESVRHFGFGEWEELDLSVVRPQRVDVYFDREVEIRFDFQEGKSFAKVPPPIFKNVIQCTEPELTLKDGTKVNEGTWLDIDDYLEAIALLADHPTKTGPLTIDVVRRWYLAGFGYLHNVYTMDIPGAPSKLWSNRINAIQQHWRRTFQIHPEWRRRIKSIAANRTGIVDQVTGRRQRSRAFFDHTVKLTPRGLAPKNSNKLGWEVIGWNDVFSLTTTAPAIVRLVDPDLQIIHLDFRLDPWGYAAEIAPGTVDGKIPGVSAKSTNVLWNQVGLEKTWKMGTVLTITPAVPMGAGVIPGRDGKGRLTKIEARPDDPEVQVRFPRLADDLTSKGPVWEIYSDATTARYAWSDGTGPGIIKSLKTSSEISKNDLEGIEPPQDALTNRFELKRVAGAEAARLYAFLMNRGEGRLTVEFDPEISQAGNLRAVSHSVRWDGKNFAATTECVMPTPSLPISMYSMLPDHVRRFLRGQLQLNED